MGKKGRKTRWRTLTITDEHSDSEESNTTTSGHRLSSTKGYPQKSYYGRFTYSSQSTPTRRYQCDGTKSTRSSSTASENKITFNEDEYTRITTPRQDVLFKKGYLNKPKTYQTQTSTGNSTTSTGNSTGNGTPDHQSTDLEYESQFVFPNGFVDQNGIYYVNSFEPYPVMVFNPPTYYQDFNCVKSKRCSTGSLTESTSPNNEEASQDLSQGETPNNVSDFNQVYNVIYPGFYYNGACQPQEMVNNHQPESRRIKKKRRRKLSRSKSVQEETTSEYTDESSDEVFSNHQNEENAKELSEEVQQDQENEEDKKEEVDAQQMLMNGLTKDPPPEEDEPKTEMEENPKKEDDEVEEPIKPKYDLKPDAEEFVPRAYRHPETIPTMETTNVQFIKIPSNFVPLPILNHPLDGFNGQNFNAFIPPGIPINFIPHHVNFIPNYINKETPHQQNHQEISEKVEEEAKETVDVPKNQIDIAKIVSKLEEAAKEQDDDDEDNVQEEKVEEKRKKTPPTPKKEPPPAPKTMRNYSDTLKKTPMVLQVQCERHERHMERQKMNKTPAKEVVMKNHVKTETPVVKTSNQWISVSNRKKRKNKNVEETEEFEEEVKENGIEEVTATIPPPPVEQTPIKEIEPIKVEETPVEVKEEVKEEKKEKIKTAPKKKSKKNNQKSSTKRVIIKDVDLSQPEPEKTVKEEKVVVVEEVVEKPEVKVEEPEIKVEEVVVEEEKVIELPPPPSDEKNEEKIEDEKKETSPEKKVKKKKKKITKPTVLSSQSSSSTTLNVADDSYDFLLEETSREKTNVEVSQELDKMIQRGMYNSLEEKIKSLNIEPNTDNFFKTIIHNISRESSVEKNNFGKILQTSNLLKSKPSSVELKKLGDFLGEGTPNSGGENKTEEEVEEEQYPITKAVKEWMTKTRENTPDVEIFKSPSTIFREFNLEVEEEEEIDLLEYWEDPVVQKKTTTSSVEEGEDVLEEYESKYGRNEDYLKIKREVEESRGNYPKHGNLPYRAICCSIM